MTTPVIVQSLPGIKRDGTVFEGDHYIDGRWCRFQRGRPRKMGGCRAVTSTLAELIHGMDIRSSNGQLYAHLGGATILEQIVMDSQGLLTAQNARIPAGFANSVNNLWQFDVGFDTTLTTMQLIAHAGQNLAAIDSTVQTPIYIGTLTAAGILVDSTMASQSGGIVVLAPYLLTFGNDGRVDVSAANDVQAVAGSARVTGAKLVKGMPTRGGGGGPSGILWSLDSLIRATFDSSLTPVNFAFDTLGEISILSSQGVVEYDSNFYWPGVDRWYMFNGVTREIENNLNQNWFFENINMAQRQKVFGFKIPRFGEIWWCYPRGSATECTHAVVFNVRENTWYDTELLSTGRTAAVFAKVYQKPFMMDLFDTDLGAGTLFTLWQHETGTDQINGADIQPIQSFFETAEITMLTGEKPEDKSLRIARMEPDFVQEGPMTVQMTGRINPRAPDVVGPVHMFQDTPATSQDETVPMKEVRRLMRFKFESNVAGGDYQMGSPIAHVEPADGRVQS